MATFLECDIGNSRLKWRLKAYDEVVLCEGVGRDTLLEQDLSALIEVRVASVKCSGIEGLGLPVPQGCSVLTAQSQSRWGSLSNSYQDPTRMGVDRWLSLIAAWHRPQKQANKAPTIIIDAGTAIKVEVLSAYGQHEGGYILPGRWVQKSSLLMATEGIRLDQGWTVQDRSPGCSTAGCVEGGINLGASVLVEHLARVYAHHHWWLTGGDADWLVRWAPPQAVLYPAMILDGLALWCQNKYDK